MNMPDRCRTVKRRKSKRKKKTLSSSAAYSGFGEFDWGKGEQKFQMRRLRREKIRQTISGS